MSSPALAVTPTGQERLPMAIVTLSLASFFLNFASVITWVCTPLLMTQLGQSDHNSAKLEGMVEGFALIIRSFVGSVSDALLRRKVFLVWGYLLSSVARFLLAPAIITEQVIASRYLDKLGNGLQASPREAYISDVAPPHMIGRAYGLNRTFSMFGSFAGSILMFVAARTDHFNAKTFLWFAAFSSLISLAVLAWGVKDPDYSPQDRAQSLSARLALAHTGKQTSGSVWSKNFWRTAILTLMALVKKIAQDIPQFSATFWKTIGVVCIVKLGYFSGNFLMFQLTDKPDAVFLGKALYQNKNYAYSLFSVLQCITCFTFAYPLGRLSDLFNRIKTIFLGTVILIISLVCFIYAQNQTSVLFSYFGIVLYGLQMSMLGAMMALLSSTMPHHLHGTGFSIFFVTSGFAVIFTNQFIMGGHIMALGSALKSLLINRTWSWNPTLNYPLSYAIIVGCLVVGLWLLWSISKEVALTSAKKDADSRLRSRS
jgi:MFS family permease